MNLFQSVFVFWWLALGGVGYVCWCAAWYRVWRERAWLDLRFIGNLALAMMFGLFTLGFAVCFEPGKDGK